MNAQHTPGPWKSTADGRIESERDPNTGIYPILGEAYVIYNHVTGDVYVTGDVCRANARLMAAAPEMLQMLQKMWAVEMNPAISAELLALIEKAKGLE